MPNTHKRTLPIRANDANDAKATTPVSTTASVSFVAGRGKNTATAFDVADLAGVVYSAGKVFDGLGTGRLDTENFLRSGSLEGITSRSDLALLQDLRDVSRYIIDNRETPINNTYVREVNAKITRSGPLHPERYRTDTQQIGVNTQHGRHEPKPVNDADLKRIVDTAMAQPDPREQALALFVEIAKAQPFEDGNKRTALFVANSVLIRESDPELLVVPVDDVDDVDDVEENGTDKAAHFNDLLARAYVFNERDGIKDLLRTEGFNKHYSAQERKKAALFHRHPELRDVKIDPHGLDGAHEQTAPADDDRQP